MILVIWILLVFPAVVYDKDKQVRFLACGLLYYIIDAAFNNKRDGK